MPDGKLCDPLARRNYEAGALTERNLPVGQQHPRQRAAWKRDNQRMAAGSVRRHPNRVCAEPSSEEARRSTVDRAFWARETNVGLGHRALAIGTVEDATVRQREPG